MSISKETLSDFKEKFEKAYKLVNEESQHDPPTDPYRSHYAAKDVLVEMMENLKNSIHSEEDNFENQFTYKVILAFVYKDLGRIYDFTDEHSTGEKYLQKCIYLIAEHNTRPEAINAYLGALNELGVLWSNRQNPEESKKYLDKAEAAYHEFKESGQTPMTIMDVFGTKDEIEKGKGATELEKLHTLTLFYMAQILGYLKELDKSARYCNMTLKRQLDANDFEPIDWALNAATLSQYYLTHNNFNVARHHLAAAMCVMTEYETKMITPGMSEDAQAQANERYKHRYADIARCWAKYGLGLLNHSKDRLMDDKDDEVGSTTDGIEKGLASTTLNETSEVLKFDSLNLIAYENMMTDQYCLTFEDAVSLYHAIVAMLDKAKEYYTADTEATEYAKIIMDYADLYRVLAFFEENPSNQSKLYKRRADHCEDLLKLLNPSYYLSICRDCWYECGLSYSMMLDVKLDALAQLKIDEAPTPHALNKINTLCKKAITHHKSFIDSFKKKDTDELMNNIPEENMQAILSSYFHLGRLYYKFITPDKRLQLMNLQDSLKYYKLFVDECEKNENLQPVFSGEVGVCKEMVSLLPLKIEKTISEMRNG